jgi:hypothetical protein
MPLIEPHCLMRLKTMGFWRTPNLSQGLQWSRVEKALENFDEYIRVQVVSVIESLHAIA